ncbi:MAG: hypothetical protein KYX64_05165 [Sphingopyxis sp.]|nr:hypothetical protein [Sphingopyxis sp.]
MNRTIPWARGAYVRPSLRFILFGSLLAAIALVNIVGFSGWHSALVGHDDAAVMADTLEHDGDDSSVPQVDLHKMSHPVVNGMTFLDADLGPVVSILFTAVIWSLPMDMIRLGIAPEGLLRPPRI